MYVTEELTSLVSPKATIALQSIHFQRRRAAPAHIVPKSMLLAAEGNPMVVGNIHHRGQKRKTRWDL